MHKKIMVPLAIHISYSLPALAIATQPECNPIYEFFGGCRNPGTTDQGTTAHNDWIAFEAFHNKYDDYKNKNEALNAQIESLLNKSILESIYNKYKQYYARLKIIDSINQTNNADTIYNETINLMKPFLIQSLNKEIKLLLDSYFKKTPLLYRGIDYDYWYKSYWPAYSGQWGGERAHYVEITTNSLADSSYFSSFLALTTENNADFQQTERSFVAKWNNANSRPWSERKEKKVYYKFKYNHNENILNRYSNFQNLSNLPDIMIKIKNTETIDELKRKIIEFRLSSFNMLLGLDALEKSENRIDQLSKVTNNLKRYFSTPLPNTTKIFGKNSTQCLSYEVNNGELDKVITLSQCNINDPTQDWAVYPIDLKYKKFVISSSKEPGKCLSSSTTRNVLTRCDTTKSSQLWILIKTKNGINVIKNAKTNQFLNVNLSTDRLGIPSKEIHSPYYKILLSGGLTYSETEWNSGYKIANQLPYLTYTYFFLKNYSTSIQQKKAALFFKRVKKSSWFNTLLPTGTQRFLNRLENITYLPTKDNIQSFLSVFKDNYYKINNINSDENLAIKEIFKTFHKLQVVTLENNFSSLSNINDVTYNSSILNELKNTSSSLLNLISSDPNVNRNSNSNVSLLAALSNYYLSLKITPNNNPPFFNPSQPIEDIPLENIPMEIYDLNPFYEPELPAEGLQFDGNIFYDINDLKDYLFDLDERLTQQQWEQLPHVIRNNPEFVPELQKPLPPGTQASPRPTFDVNEHGVSEDAFRNYMNRIYSDVRPFTDEEWTQIPEDLCDSDFIPFRLWPRSYHTYSSPEFFEQLEEAAQVGNDVNAALNVLQSGVVPISTTASIVIGGTTLTALIAIFAIL